MAIDPEGMPFLAGTHAVLAGSLIGVRSFGHEWSGKRVWALMGPPAWSDKRLRGAGIDPVSWKIIDVRRAAFAWEQLRTGHRKYSPTRQELLIGSDQETPDINAKLVFSTERDNIKTPEKKKTEEASSQHFSKIIGDHFRDKNII